MHGKILTTTYKPFSESLYFLMKSKKKKNAWRGGNLPLFWPWQMQEQCDALGRGSQNPPSSITASILHPIRRFTRDTVSLSSDLCLCHNKGFPVHCIGGNFCDHCNALSGRSWMLHPKFMAQRQNASKARLPLPWQRKTELSRTQEMPWKLGEGGDSAMPCHTIPWRSKKGHRKWMALSRLINPLEESQDFTPKDLETFSDKTLHHSSQDCFHFSRLLLLCLCECSLLTLTWFRRVGRAIMVRCRQRTHYTHMYT